MARPSQGWWLKLANILGFLLFTASSLYTKFTDKDRVGAPVDTYLSPAPWFFDTWYCINALFFGMVMYQYSPSGSTIIVEVLGWKVPFLFVLNALCGTGYAFHKVHLFRLLAFAVLCLCAVIVSELYGSLRTGPEPVTWLDALLIRVPLSMYHAFITVIFFSAALGVIGADTSNNAGILTKLFVLVVLFFLQSAAAAYVFFGNVDVVGAFVISLGIFAIFQHQKGSTFIRWSAFVLQGTSQALLAQRDAPNGTDEEATPLVQ
ncbi:hypothetical protein MVES1_002176 [Malassezia vespertilionis]|uniref:Uncharacterized protein n=1 Tax=Malassezia vespertilionis TaxID=2020962 RepID=A0A2N1JBR9_9BASI|nr:uncharacterized protein MVES1_002176 [Malassezia vespertilionis]PKI84000.1 hypothetical protein MVES_002052 [Malassezia vespertilionis]WFD06822.1 hypothetical protein MVES1_002176 [Malassezia vespertilionis]